MAPTYDAKYYISHNPTYAVVGDNVVQSIEKAGDHELEDKHATDEESKKMFDVDGKPVINFGLKSKAIDTVKSQQASMLAQTDWAIIRKSDNGTEIPDNIQTYRDAVRVKAEEMEEAITKATTMEAFKKLSITTHTKAGKVKDLAILQDWPQLGE
jgi:hypothetical protein